MLPDLLELLSLGAVGGQGDSLTNYCRLPANLGDTFRDELVDLHPHSLPGLDVGSNVLGHGLPVNLFEAQGAVLTDFITNSSGRCRSPNARL